MEGQRESKKTTRKARFALDRKMASRANQAEHANTKIARDRAMREYLDVSIDDQTVTGLHARFEALPKQERSMINARAHQILEELQAPIENELRQHKREQNRQIYKRLSQFSEAARKAGSGHKHRNKIFPTKAEYEMYLMTEDWKVVRQRIRDRADGKCELCDKSGSQVHHLLYTEPGTELDNHLLFVCYRCHQKAHGTYKLRRTDDSSSA